jgi:hypothetical protein
MSLVPLTTTFTPSSSCLGTNNIWWQIVSTSPCATTMCSFGYFVQGPPSTSDCLPSSYQVPNYGNPESGFTFYYPGTCPSGYIAACTSTKSLGPYTATLQMCCPSGFKCQTIATLEWQTTLGCFSPFTATTTIGVTLSSEAGFTSTTFLAPSGGAVNGYAIAIAIATQNPGFSNQSTGSPNSTTSQAPAATQSSGLNTTVISVLAAFLTVSIISLFWIGFHWYRNRRRKSNHVRLDSKPPAIRSSVHPGASETELRPLTRFSSLQH